MPDHANTFQWQSSMALTEPLYINKKELSTAIQTVVFDLQKLSGSVALIVVSLLIAFIFWKETFIIFQLAGAPLLQTLPYI